MALRTWVAFTAALIASSGCVGASLHRYRRSSTQIPHPWIEHVTANRVVVEGSRDALDYGLGGGLLDDQAELVRADAEQLCVEVMLRRKRCASRTTLPAIAR